MTTKTFIKLIKYAPLFHFHLEIPFVSISTAILYRHYERFAFSYVLWKIQVWKWKWNVDIFRNLDE